MITTHNKAKPFVSIWMCTYNHSEYIAQAIDGVLSQKTSFPYKLIISDDFSTDGTREVCIKLRNRYPNLIDLILPNENTQIKVVWDQLYPACFSSGAKYLSMCEGDDYWTDPLKLQRQVNFLEIHPDYSLCQHLTRVVETVDSFKPYIFFCEKDELLVSDLLKRNFYSRSLEHVPDTHTSSSVFRMDLFKSGLPPRFNEVFSGDKYLFLWAAIHGKVKVLPDIMSEYCQHQGGLTKSGSDIYAFHCQNQIKDFSIFKETLPETFRGEIETIVCGLQNMLEAHMQRVDGYLNVWRSLVKKYDWIAIFGAGKLTKMLLFYLKNKQLKMPNVIFDSYPKKQSLYGIPIKHVSEMGDCKVDVVALSTQQFEDEMRSIVLDKLPGIPAVSLYS